MPLSSASPSLGARVIGSSPAIFIASRPEMILPL
ncbi:Uncharacterised protein [Vibrio cholerae]|nr:Uncharacterised protein [Vibrio cholerae]CSD61504.1 Uncharacterised protein [Vibrio cholerae]